MGHKRIGDNGDGYKYAMAVMKYVDLCCLLIRTLTTPARGRNLSANRGFFVSPKQNVRHSACTSREGLSTFRYAFQYDQH